MSQAANFSKPPLREKSSSRLKYTAPHSVEPNVAAPAIGWSTLAWMEKTMSKTNELSDAELEVVIRGNGTAVVGLSVGNQTAIALNQELKAAYLAHQFGWSSQWGSSEP
jgi:hypothetical protein